MLPLPVINWIEPVTSGYRVTVTFHLFQEEIQQSIKIGKLLNDGEPAATKKGLLEDCESSEEMRNLMELEASKRLAGKQ
jgi:hypothetical protein